MISLVDLRTDENFVVVVEASASVQIVCQYETKSHGTSEMYEMEYTVANQLQFACRQLHQESCRLSLKYKKVVFSVPNWRRMYIWDKAISLCARFLSTLPSSITQDITTLTIKVDSKLDWEDNEREALAAFCRTNPTAQIHVHEGRSSQPQHMAYLANEYY